MMLVPTPSALSRTKVSAMQFDQSLRQRQAEACAFPAPRQGTVDLAEAVQRNRYILRPHANAVVGDANDQGALAAEGGKLVPGRRPG